ncbi:BamA/TamA family outer membrane protein [Algoriphagus halophytocola]|uniref:BamA/TamA family outer membrane protein n=1 Tax=Algoriphagus halophytocola TaxID=2991499 RepID=A0ABY6MI01_9BACT|nr:MULTISPECIES: BamA/TamA family outer membrane protein [unclassified Algoriphagus]UZD21926.1 BamA/TamA family outer membrane protein [Algoriphagus sp. TR-M5]WBL43177.1 BamA/TamA family outer membrane protein [Algoriphagus sp. TR-M9]
MKLSVLVCLFYFFWAGPKAFSQTGFWLKMEDGRSVSSWQSFPSAIQALAKVDSTLSGLQASGFLEAYATEEYLAQDSLLVVLELGNEYLWEDLRTDQVPLALRNKVAPVTSSYADAERWMKGVIRNAENSGFPFAQLKIDSLAREGNRLSGTIVYDSGPIILWDSLAVEGNTSTKINYLQQLTGIKAGEPFSQNQLEVAEQILRRSPYFRLVAPAALSFQIKKAKPTFTLSDRNTNVFDGVIGFLPNENEPGKMLITGQLDLQLYHLGGRGRDISVNWQRLNVQSQSLELAAKESFVFNSPLDVMLEFSLLKQDSTFLNRYLGLDFGYHAGERSYLRFFTKRQSGDLLSSSGMDTVSVLPDVADFRWNQYGLGWEWDALDFPYFPRRGTKINVQVSIGNKKILENTGIPSDVYGGLDLNTPQYAGWASVETHVFVSQNWGMWFRGSGGLIENENLLLNDLYRIGGLKSIRGFNEKFFFARSYAYVNAEQRLFFGENSYLLAFADFGILENPFFVSAIDRPVSFGAGINLDTGSGVFSFIYGVGKSNLQTLQFSHSKIHFGYLARF